MPIKVKITHEQIYSKHVKINKYPTTCLNKIALHHFLQSNAPNHSTTCHQPFNTIMIIHWFISTLL